MKKNSHPMSKVKTIIRIVLGIMTTTWSNEAT